MVHIPTEELPFLYADFMREIKRRLEAIRNAIERFRNAETGKESYLDAEFCVLQLRMIIELMTLACLTAHNEVEDFRTKAFVKTWNAETLIKIMAKHTPSAFPTPIEVSEPDEAGVRNLTFKPLSAEIQDHIVQIYRECGDFLHVGNLRSLVKNKGRSIWINEVRENASLLVDILGQHVVILPGMKRMMFAFLRYRPTEDVHCFLNDYVPDGLVDPKDFPTYRTQITGI